MMYAMPLPCKAGGIFAYLRRSRMAAKAVMAKSQPSPEPIAYDRLWATVGKLRSCMKSEPPRIAQLTAMSGKKMPNAMFSAGK